MGIISKGILGGFSGKVGTVIGGNWKGIDYMRSKSNRGKFVPTQTQHSQQLKFGVVMRFVQPMAGLLNITFRDFAIKMTGINNAFQYNIKNAITGTYPNFSLDYSIALVSRGDLPNILGPAVTLGTGSILTWSWTDNSGAGIAKPNDQAILVAYCPALKQAIYTTGGGTRSALTGDLDVSPFSGHTVQTYIGFLAYDGRKVSNSFFTGAVPVS